MPMDERLRALMAWLEIKVQGGEFGIEPASEDASFRRYFRVSTRDHSLIAMDAPPEKEDCRPFVEVATLLLGCGTNVPQVVEADLNQGFLLLTDLGSSSYLQVLNDRESSEGLYEDAILSLIRFQAKASSEGLPPYDRQLLDTEMGLFRDWLVHEHLGLNLDERHLTRLEKVFDFLARSALEQPRTFVHRDYHSRNLMVCSGNSPGVLDFQDAVQGPVTYDLVSLLKDCYFRLSSERIRELVGFYLREASGAGIDTGEDDAAFLRWFELMGVQRHLKASGIFARLWHRDGKPGYLGDIPRTLSYISDCASAYPELAYLLELVEKQVLPALEPAAGAR